MKLAPVLFLVLAPLVHLGCAPQRRPMQPMPMMPVAPAFDPTAAALLERCDRTLRAVEGKLAQPQADTLASLARERLALAQKVLEIDRAAEGLQGRIEKARRGARALARSEHEQVAVATAIIDLDEGRDPMISALPNRVRENEAFRDLVEATSLLKRNRADRARITAQMDAIDTVFSTMMITPAPVDALPAPMTQSVDQGQPYLYR